MYVLFCFIKCRIRFVQIQTWPTSTKFIKKNNNIYNTKFIFIVRNVEYSILLVMSELSTVRYDHALGLWIAGTRASSVDGELPWRSSGD